MPVFALVTPPVSAFICHLPFLRRSPERMNSLTAMRKRQDATGLRVRARAESTGAHAGKGEATGGAKASISCTETVLRYSCLYPLI